MLVHVKSGEIAGTMSDVGTRHRCGWVDFRRDSGREHARAQSSRIDAKLRSNITRIRLNGIHIKSVVSISHLKVYLLHCVGELCSGEWSVCVCVYA